MCHGRPRSVTETVKGSGPAQLVNLPPLVTEPMLAPLSPLPDLNLPDRTELLQVSVLPSVVSFSLVVPAWLENGPPGVTLQVAAATAGPAPRATVRMAAVMLNAIRPDRTAVTSRIRSWLRPDAAGCQ